MSAAKPYESYRVLEISSGAGAHCGRVLADLGAEVVKIEPPGGDPMRRVGPFAGDTGISFAWFNANKKGLVIDLDNPNEQARVRAALASFDVLIDGNPPGWLTDRGLDPAVLRAQHPELIIVSVTDFGQTGPYRDWQTSTVVAWALAGSLIRCGQPDSTPIGPPYQLTYALAGMTAASAVGLALWERTRTGNGDWIDASILEMTQAQADWSVPIYAYTGITAPRAGAGMLYPVFRTQDGWVRMVNLSHRQWLSLRKWLGSPEELSAPEWDNPLFRAGNREVVNALCAAKCATGLTRDLCSQGQAEGVGIVPVHNPLAVMDADEHFAERGTFVNVPLPGGLSARAPGAFFRMDLELPVSPRVAPALGANDGTLEGTRAPISPRGGSGAPLSGYRVLEVGSGAVAPEITRILGEYGADVIKLESRQQIDFMRLQGPNLESSFGWASSNRNKRSVLVDMKQEDGRRIGRLLAESADIIVENNTGGVMERLGIGYNSLSEVNPKLVFLSSQAFGASGPATGHGGFGPSNQAVSGVSYLWNHPGAEVPEGVQVIFPDHILGRSGALAVVAALEQAERTGRGQHIDMAQSEFAMACIAEAFLESDLLGESVPPRGNANLAGAPYGVFPTLGDDAWIAVSVETPEQWTALKSVVCIESWDSPEFDTREGRMEMRDLIEAELGAFTSQQPAVSLMRTLQGAGVPAGAAYTTPQVLADPHLFLRGWAPVVDHPVMGSLRMEGVPFFFEYIELTPTHRAPLWGEHTDEVLAGWLGMDAAAIEDAREAGALA